MTYFGANKKQGGLKKKCGQLYARAEMRKWMRVRMRCFHAQRNFISRSAKTKWENFKKHRKAQKSAESVSERATSGRQVSADEVFARVDKKYV
jgi:hypothetical protein